MAPAIAGPIPGTCCKASGDAAHAREIDPKFSSNPCRVTPPS
jgi:hypothetical protein